MKVYIVLTRTGTILSKMVWLIKHYQYTHVSISLDRRLNEMYSFGRVNPYNPFIGGFIHEQIDQGTFKRFSQTKCVVLKFSVSEDEYQRLVSRIDYFKRNKDKYEFNVLGLLWVIFNKRRVRQNKFYCAEFVKYVIDEAKITNNLPFVITPNDFFKLENVQMVYEGLLQEYCYH